MSKTKFVPLFVSVTPELRKAVEEALEKKRKAGEYLSLNTFVELLLREKLGLPEEDTQKTGREARYGSKIKRLEAQLERERAAEKTRKESGD